MATSVIGLDIGTTRVRGLEAQQSRGSVTIQRYAEVPLPLGAVRDGEAAQQDVVVAALRQLWAVGKFSHRDVVMGVGNQRVMVRNLALPRMPLPQLRSSLPFQVQGTLLVAVEDALLDFYPTRAVTGQDGPMLDGLLVAATRDTVQANVSAAEGAGLRPTMVDLNAFALMRAHVNSGLGARVAALVDIGASTTNIVVVDETVPRLVRSIASGGQTITDAVAAAANTSHAEAEAMKRQVGVGFAVPRELEVAADVINHVSQSLVESIRNTFVYYSSNNPGRPVELVVLTGGGAYLTGLGQYLSSATRLPVAMADLLKNSSVGRSVGLEQIQGAESTLAVVLGLATAVAA